MPYSKKCQKWATTLERLRGIEYVVIGSWR